MPFWNKKPSDKTAKVAQVSLGELRQELQDMEIQIITYNHHRNAILEKISYFEQQLSHVDVVTQEPPKVVLVDKVKGEIIVPAA